MSVFLVYYAGMQALILTGGFGSRLMPVVNDRPKVMALINGRPFLDYIINTLKKNNFKEIILATGYLSGYISDYFRAGKALGVNITYSSEELPLGTAGAIRNAYPLLEETFLVLNGDTYLSINYLELINYHIQKSNDMTIVINQQKSRQKKGVIRLDNSKKITSFVENDRDAHLSKAFTNTGVYVMNKKIMKSINKNHKISLENEFVPSLLSKNSKVYGFITKSDFIDIGTPESYSKAIQRLGR